jgi:hypothetical protein
MKTKKAQATGIIVIILLGILVVGGLTVAWQQDFFKSAQQRAISTALVDTDCEIAPSLGTSFIDSINLGTSVTGSSDAGWVNNDYRPNATTNLKKGDSVVLLGDATNYIAMALPAKTIDCGSNLISASMNKLDGAPTVKVFNDEGNVVSDSADGGAVNQTSSSAPITLEMTVTTPADENIGAMVFVIESSNKTEVDSIAMSSQSATVEKVSVPEIYSQNAGGTDVTKAFRADNIADDGGVTTFHITLTPETGKTMGADLNSLYIEYYVEQDYVDTDGTLKTGVEDSDGTAKHVSAASDDYDLSIGLI